MSSTADRSAPGLQPTPAALSAAVTTKFAAVERQSVRLTAALVATAYLVAALLSALPALSWLGRLPSWLPVALITGSASVVVAVMPLALLPGRVVDAWTALTYLSMAGNDQWRRASVGPFPDAVAADAWLRHHAGAEHELLRAQVLVIHGRATEATLPDEAILPDLASRFVHAQLAWYVAFAVEERATSRARDRIESLVEAHASGRDVAEARAVARMLDAVEAHAGGRDWIAQLAAGRRALGRVASRIVLRWLIVPRLLAYGRISLGIFVVIQVVSLVFRP
ncbi:MAG: hypothetical protein ACR2GO_05825 [Candidatus Limnocylindria bacterium]